MEIGDTFCDGRYRVVEKLGWGHFSTVWKAVDTSQSNGNSEVLVAVKIQKSAEHYREAAYDEIKLLQKCSDVGQAAISSNGQNVEGIGVIGWGTGADPRIVKLQDWFEHVGPNGKHVCMVFEMLGDSLLQVMRLRAAGASDQAAGHSTMAMPILTVKHVTRQVRCWSSWNRIVDPLLSRCWRAYTFCTLTVALSIPTSNLKTSFSAKVLVRAMRRTVTWQQFRSASGKNQTVGGRRMSRRSAQDYIVATNRSNAPFVRGFVRRFPELFRH